MSHFIDEARIHVHAGDGGDGCVAFRREKYLPNGGPSGGDGGRGGSIIFVADPQLTTLLDFRYKRRFQAPPGQAGMGSDCHGRGGEDLVVPVPVGTVVKDAETEEELFDFGAPGVRMVAAQGGRGGRGNIHFKTSTNQAPRTAEPGTPGQQRELLLELRLLADVGIVGFPNVGKSTLIAHVSRARPKIADYPFTTLAPNLGVVQLSGMRSFVLADVPGLIEGAHLGAGLGIRFLKHLARTRALLHVVTLTGDPERDPLRDYEIVRAELAAHDEAMAKRPEIVVLNQMDRPEVEEAFGELEERFRARGIELIPISAASGAGLQNLLERLWKLIRPPQNPESSVG